MSKGARQKGSNFERETAHSFSDTFGIPFKRTPLSGGWAKEVIRGDITCGEPTFKLVVECKNHKKFSVPEWWRQVTCDALDTEIPLLIIHTSSRYHSTKQYTVKQAVQGSYTFLRLRDYKYLLKPRNFLTDELVKSENSLYKDRTIQLSKYLHDMFMEDSKLAFIETDLGSGTETFVFIPTKLFLLNINTSLCYNKPVRPKYLYKQRRTWKCHLKYSQQ